MTSGTLSTVCIAALLCSIAASGDDWKGSSEEHFDFQDYVNRTTFEIFIDPDLPVPQDDADFASSGTTTPRYDNPPHRRGPKKLYDSPNSMGQGGMVMVEFIEHDDQHKANPSKIVHPSEKEETNRESEENSPNESEDVPDETPETEDAPNETPESEDVPDGTPESDDAPDEASETDDVPDETPETEDAPNETPLSG